MVEARRQLDIKALLNVALEQQPKEDVHERVMDRVALATTAIELARLLFIAPTSWLLDPHHPDDPPDDPPQ